MVDDDDMNAIMKDQGKSLEEKTKKLIDAANEAGGTDNITVVLAHFI